MLKNAHILREGHVLAVLAVRYIIPADTAFSFRARTGGSSATSLESEEAGLWWTHRSLPQIGLRVKF